jgi:hypothetical protein
VNASKIPKCFRVDLWLGKGGISHLDSFGQLVLRPNMLVGGFRGFSQGRKTVI